MILLGNSKNATYTSVEAASCKGNKTLVYIFNALKMNDLDFHHYYGEEKVSWYVLEQLRKDADFWGFSFEGAKNRINPRLFDVIKEIYRDGCFFFMAETYDEASRVVEEAHKCLSK